MTIKVTAANRIGGKISIPGDKSISHRAIMLGAIATGKTEITGFLNGEDCLNTVSLFQQLGVEIERHDATSFIVFGKGRNLTGPTVPFLDVGNSGTTIRLATGILAGQHFTSQITGDDSIRKRPMKRIIDPLTMMGAEIISRDGYAPLKIIGQELTGIEYISPIASAQVKSAILLAGLYASGDTTVIEPLLSRNHTEKMLEYFGADITCEGNQATIVGGTELSGQRLEVPGDFSSAAFLIAAALLVPGSELLITNVGVNPTRTGFLDVVRLMNGDVELHNERFFGKEEVADILVRGSNLTAINVAGELIPRLIDELPLFALIASQADGMSIVSDAAELRVKESDRIETIAQELAKLGVKVEKREDGFAIIGKQKIRGGTVMTHGDHRIGLTMAIAGLIAESGVEIIGSKSIAISYPDFFADLKAILK